ncbi:hypothetical protein COY90_01025 [Candidatus Roizmanbacteria bacterium CG_4_10_14_0_8_um_filter_39_9]|uniref:Uncharacterized protein n=1 Tax=Candidatus Roizmanbacteria bacterium CG_4_10_14_0_8_um_filter_39_9 TaxID=1974829 RepID=A0A2M7QDR4_9BACT|nr:MAG: hypothetical protein COY90_01025 [Candidatus Roizmanbacteria bacterium CG_4_10_14_0_8_um_filter_39_9]
MKSNLFELKRKMNEVYSIAPNDLGHPALTKGYRRINIYFKNMPFLVVIPASIIFAFLLYMASGYIIVRLTSILQYGF